MLARHPSNKRHSKLLILLIKVPRLLTEMCYQPSHASFFRLHDVPFLLKSAILRMFCLKKSFLTAKTPYVAIMPQGIVAVGQNVNTGIVSNIRKVSPLPFMVRRTEKGESDSTVNCREEGDDRDDGHRSAL